MKYRFLGRTGLRVSELCFGTMSFGGDADEGTSGEMYRACRDAGVNFFDVADVYNGGYSEEILGRLIACERDQIVLATKAYFPTGDGPNDRGSSRYHLVRAVEASLRRLNTDRIDIFYLHRFDDFTSLEESLRTLDDLVRSGKILYPAISNFSAWQTMKAVALCERNGWARPVCIQPMYNLVKRQAEVELLPMAESEGIGVAPYSPLGGGLLTGKYGKNRRPESGRLVDIKIYGERYAEQRNYDIAERFTELAEQMGHHPVSLAVRWAGAHPGVTCPIIGARNVGQLAPSLASTEIELDAEAYEAISNLSPEPPPATDRAEERTEHNLDKR